MQCPGQDMRYWKPGAIFDAPCPKCGTFIEFFKDEAVRKCPNCGHKVANPRMDFGCATYCQYAEQCLGQLPVELLAERKELLKDRVAVEMKRYFGSDFKRISHATKVARYAEEIGKAEGADMVVILLSAYLHDIGIHEAERKYHSTAGTYQEIEGPPIAREILNKLKAPQEVIAEVCDIIGHHHHPRSKETLNFQILYDADLIVNLEEEPKEEEKVKELLQKAFFTEAGRRLAKDVLLKK